MDELQRVLMWMASDRVWVPGAVAALAWFVVEVFRLVYGGDS